MRRRWLAGAGTAALLGATGCGSDPPTVTVEIVLGHESDALSRAPAVTRVDVVAHSVVSDFSAKASAAPGGSFDLGELTTDEPYAFEATGVDASGAAVVRGRTLSGIDLSLGAAVLPLFVQRTDGWARPPEDLAPAHVRGVAASFAERFLLSTGGAASMGGSGADMKAIEFYDLLTYGSAASQTSPRAATTIVTRGSAVMLVDGKGATTIDFAVDSSQEATPPDGLASFGDVAGGRVIEAGGGASFVVGATRAEGPTRAVLAVSAAGALSSVQLVEARAGAAATWIDGVGLVVAGGSETAAGVEVLADGATAFAPRAFPPDATVGAGAFVTGDHRIALVGGSLAGAAAPTRLLDPTCATDCKAAELADATPPVVLSAVSAFALASGSAIVVGEQAGDPPATRTFRVDLGAPAATELLLREPRSGAAVVPAPNGTLAVVGGVHPDGTPAATIEMLWTE